ncbi:MAG: peptidoglycan-binding protein [Vulcanimicrobiota bacterium]
MAERQEKPSGSSPDFLSWARSSVGLGPEQVKLSPGQEVSQGATGDQARHIQERLGMKPTGNFDAGTADGVRTFQKEHGLAVDGIVGNETADTLNGGLGLGKNERIRSGGSGPKVERLQEMLNRGGAKLDTDGKFGQDTARAVRDFQKKHNLDIDGVVGPETQKKLNELHSDPNARQGPSPVGDTQGKADTGRTQGPTPPARDTKGGRSDTGKTDTGRTETDAGNAGAIQAGQLPQIPKGLDTQGQYDYLKGLVEANGGKFDPNRTTVVGLRGLSPDGKRHSSGDNVGPYNDTFAVLKKGKDGQPSVQYFQGSAHAGQKRGPASGGVAQLRPGNYKVSPNGDRYGMPSYHVKTQDSSGSVPAYRDRNADGKISDSERQFAEQNNTKATAILFHNGRFQDHGSSIGCQTMRPDVYRQFSNAIGGNQGFDYSLIDANKPTPGGAPTPAPPANNGGAPQVDPPANSSGSPTSFADAFRDGRAGRPTSLGNLKTLAEARRSDRGLYFRAGAQIDTDGSGPSHGDSYHQSRTSLRGREGYPNADKTPYFVLPPQVMRSIGAKPGDLGLIKRGDKIIPAVFADVGPRNKIGEVSYLAAKQLGINPHPNRGGTHRPEVEYMVFPGSGTRSPSLSQLTPEALEARVRALLAGG